ncbi:helix-turn-helix transcriptional regulator [Sinanaerobacter sp. ZZT-01]|uniref:helix-turn-helix transcriptional regulator n=1 Tax=Sinanaerobacter sp. ZZT-01 TaxID=3111540 RepID=UPI002D772287|nr:helix-turn-helix transcriptional regulator [Sinanaerobacter sp. ZZT-01]WRR92219.1 helix-turn-helix transcriptional regulator [Sinanaerobacter sp. ZZT-01]
MDQNFADKITKLRKSKNMTQQELAEQLGVTNKAVSRWETGEGYPEVTLLIDLAQVFGVTVDYLFQKGNSSTEMNQLRGKEGATKRKGNLPYRKEKLIWIDFLSFVMPLFSLLLFILLLCIPALGGGLSFCLFLLFWGISLYFRKNYYWKLREELEEGEKTTAWCTWYRLLCILLFFPIQSIVKNTFFIPLAERDFFELFKLLGEVADENWRVVALYVNLLLIALSLLLTGALYIWGIYFVTANEKDVNHPPRILFWLYDSLDSLDRVQHIKLDVFHGVTVICLFSFFYLNLDKIGMKDDGLMIKSNRLWLCVTVIGIVFIYAAALFCFFQLIIKNIPKKYFYRNCIVLSLVAAGICVSGQRVYIVTNTGRIVDPDAVMNWDLVSSALQLNHTILFVFLLFAFVIFITFNRQARK